MGKRATVALLSLGLLGVGAYRLRRQIVARLLGLPPARHDVSFVPNVPVPMPDGVVLMADHYAPKAEGPFPTILIRSPYGRGLEAKPFGYINIFLTRLIAERGFHVVYQGTRGRFDAGGSFNPFADEAADGRATLEWIARQPWFDGNLGMWGASYLGYTQWAVAAGAPPYLKALVPMVTSARFPALIYPDGAFALETMLRWTVLVKLLERTGLAAFRNLLRLFLQQRRFAAAFRHLPIVETDVVALGKPVSFYRRWLTEPPGDDAYWRAIDHGDGLSRVSAAVHLVGGWYDLFLRELLADYAALKASGKTPYLTIGPWSHSDGGVALTGLREGLAWLGAHLKGDSSRLRARAVRIFVMGANEWREEDAWPVAAREVPYFLHSGGRLAAGAPEEESAPDHYRYDPADPTPVVGGALFNPQAGPRDNRALEARPDVLCYTTAPLGSALEVVGSPRLVLYVRSSLAHADFFGRLCDVHPDGRSINVCDGLCRVAPGKGEPQPDGSLRLTVDLWSTAYRFRPGHRLRLQVSSGAHPRWNRNLGTGDPVATARRAWAADQTIYHDRAHPSAVVLPVTGEESGVL